MKIQSQEVMLEKIRSGKYFITKCYMDTDENDVDEYEWNISSGMGTKMTFLKITEERAREWLALGAELLEL